MQPTRDGPRKRYESFGLPAWQIAGFAVLFAAMLALIAIFPEHMPLIIVAATAIGGAGKLVARQLDPHENDELPPASPAFRALADPRRPLTDDDPVSGDRHGEERQRLPSDRS
jgi:hypothetical protein